MTDLIPQNAIDNVAERIQERTSKNYNIPVLGQASNLETPQVFEIMPFMDIDKVQSRFFAVDGSYNHHTFYNGLSLALYRAGYICYHYGKLVRMNTSDDPTNLAQIYSPNNVLVLREDDLPSMYDECLALPPVAAFLEFCGERAENIFAYSREIVSAQISTFLGFAQEVCEWSLIYEIATRPEIASGDVVLRDGALRSLQIKQKYIVKLGRFLKDKGIRLAAITKQSPVKVELSYTFSQIDAYLQDQLKQRYSFTNSVQSDRKLCVFFEVPEAVLLGAYGGGSMYAKKGISGGRGCGLFFAARLDYVEKLQNYDWLIVDLNILDVIPALEKSDLQRSIESVQSMMYDLTSLTQEHYVLGYPYPLVEAHNTVTVQASFKDEMIARVKESLYRTRRLDHTEIENLFIDTHNRF